MPYSDESYNLRIELDTKDCEVSPAQLEKMERDLQPLHRVTKDFPVSDLYITVIHHPRSKDYHLKTSLVLSGRTLFTGDRDEHIHPAYDRCVRKLVKKVEAYKHELENTPELAKHRKGTHHDLVPSQAPDAERLQEAVRTGDYATFRRETLMYEEEVRKRIGRWVQRYPEVDAEIDGRLKLADIVEEVFLNAFERYEQRPNAVRLGQWLEQLIDPSIKLLLRHPDEEMENINFARTLTDTREE